MEQKVVDPLLRKAVGDLRTPVILWGIGLGLLLTLTILLYPSVADVYGGLFDEMPPGFAAFFGMGESVDRLEGYLKAEFFSYGPLVLGIFTILAGTGAIVGEEAQGTLDLLLALPVSRRRYATARLLGMAAAVSGVLLIVALSLISVFFIDVQGSITRILVALLLLVPFQIVLGLGASLLAQLFGSRMVGGSAMALVLVASYVLDSLGNLNTALAHLRPIYVTTYAQGQAVVGEVSWGKLGLLLVAMVVLGVANVAVLDRRDLGARRGLSVVRAFRRLGARNPQPPNDSGGIEVQRGNEPQAKA